MVICAYDDIFQEEKNGILFGIKGVKAHVFDV